MNRSVGVLVTVIVGVFLSVAALMVDADVADPSLIHACIDPNGLTRIVSLGDSCKTSETPVHWSIVGGISGYQIVQNQVFVPPNTATNVNVDCPSGKKGLGGGFSIETPDDVKIFSSEPSDGQGNLVDHAWNIFVHNISTVNTRQATAIAICAVAK